MLRPWAEVSGSQTDFLTPWHDGRAGIIPFQSATLGGQEISHGGWDTGDMPCQGEKLRVSNPLAPGAPRPAESAAPISISVAAEGAFRDLGPRDARDFAESERLILGINCGGNATFLAIGAAPREAV